MISVPKHIWHIYPFPIGMMQYDGWMVIREARDGLADKAARKYTDSGDPLTKQEAIDIGEDIAERNEPAQLVIHEEPIRGKQGNLIYPIQDERTYGPADDPYPPRG